MKRYFFNLTLNTRDLGGYHTKYNKDTKYLRFIRSDAFRFLNEEDKKFLYDHNFRLSLDFRTEEVVKRLPSNLSNDERFDYYNIPLQEGSNISLSKEKPVTLYMQMIAHHDVYFKVFSLISNTPYNVIFNCTAGKDRTGILACLLLLLAGVSEEDILDDYQISEVLINEKINEVRNFCPTFPQTLGESKRETMEEFLKLFKEKYQNKENYLTLIGLSEEQINRIRNKLIGE